MYLIVLKGQPVLKKRDHLPTPSPPQNTKQDDIFTTAEHSRATILLAFLRTSPDPAMVRSVFLKTPNAGRAALRLAVEPLRVPTEGATRHAVAAAAARTAAGATWRLESWQPLSGLESLVHLLNSSAGAAALAVTLGLEVTWTTEVCACRRGGGRGSS